MRPEIAIAALMALTACGRLGFDELGSRGNGDGGPGEDAMAGGDGASGPDAGEGDPAGFWVIDEALLRGEQVIRLRSDLDGGLRGDLGVSDSDPPTINARWIELTDGFATQLETAGGTLEVDESDLWVVREDVETFVFQAAFAGANQVALSFLAADPRSTTSPEITSMTLVRAPPPRGDVVGDWRMSAIQFPGLPLIPAGSCVNDNAKGSGLIVGTFTMPVSRIATADITSTSYPTFDCTGKGIVESTMVGGFFETDGDQYRTWGDHGESASFASTGSIEPQDNGFRFTRSSCASTTDCDGIPEIVEIAPVPGG